MSLLLGLPIPYASIGNFIPGILSYLPQKQQLYALHYNAKRLLAQIIQSKGLEYVREQGT